MCTGSFWLSVGQVALSPPVVVELRVFKGLMPFLSSDWWSRWNLLVSTGVSTSMWTHEEVCQAGRTRERDRFRDCRGVCARVHAMEATGFGTLGGSGSWESTLTFPRWRRARRHGQNMQVPEARAMVMSVRLCFDRYPSQNFEFLIRYVCSPVMSLQDFKTHGAMGSVRVQQVRRTKSPLCSFSQCSSFVDA